MSADLTSLPGNLPIPIDDGACDHLAGAELPVVALPSTSGRVVDMTQVAGPIVIFAYPLTGRPGRQLPTDWDAIPGARGCTPEACGFRDHYSELRGQGAALFGLSTQSTEYQQEVRDRLQLPFHLLSDEMCVFADSLRLPTFTVDRMRLLKRLTLICRNGRIEHVFYPVFPPDQHAAQVVMFLKTSTSV